jgi:hypothetical protein
MIPLCSRFDSLAFTFLPVSISSEIDFSRSPLDNSTLIMVNSSDARHYRPLFVVDHRGVGVVGFLGGVGDDLQMRPADPDLSQTTVSSGGVYQKPRS